MTDDERERLGRIARDAWVVYCRETGDEKPAHVAPWEELGEWDREADRRIAEAVAAEVRRQERTRFAALHGTLAALHGTAAQIDRCFRCGWVKLARPDEDARHFHDLERHLAALEEDEP